MDATRQLSINRLSKLTGFDRDLIKKKLDAAGLKPQKGPKNSLLYLAPEALPVLYATASSGSDDLDQKRKEQALKFEAARAEKAELELRIRRNEFVAINEVAATVASEYSAVRSRIRSIPSALARQLSLTNDPNEVGETLTRAIDDALSELCSDENYGNAHSNPMQQPDAASDEAEACQATDA